MSDAHFDRCQFDDGLLKRKSKIAVSVRYTPTGWDTTGIAYEDFRRMGVVDSSIPMRCANNIPEFALSDTQLRLVIQQRAQRHGDGSNQHGKNVHKRAVRRAGSYEAFLAGIAYRSWRLGQDSVAVAEQMGITPSVVRRHLHNMAKAARELEAQCWPAPLVEWKPPKPRRKPIAYVEGTCWECRERPIDTARNKWRCTECCEARRARQHEIAAKGICVNCRKRPVVKPRSAWLCERCLDRLGRQQRVRWHSAKRQS
jgi:hypothetical protein